MTENYYKLRIDYQPILDDKYKELETRYMKCFTRVMESPYGTNSHYHYYLETISREDTIRTYIRKVFGSGNGVYSLKRVERYPVAYIAYCMKEQELYNSGVPQHIIDSAVEYNSKVVVEIQKKKQEKKPLWEQCYLYVKEHLGTFEEYSNMSTLYDPLTSYKEMVIHYIIEYHIEKDRLIRAFQIEAIAVTLLVRLAPAYKSDLKRRILERI